MTISPVAAPSAPPAPGTPSSGAGAGERFDALVQQHLAGDSEEPLGSGSAEANAAILEAASAPSAVRSDSLAALIAGLLAPTVARPGGTAGAVGAAGTAAATVDGMGVAPAATGSGAAALGLAAASLTAAGVPGGPHATGAGVTLSGDSSSAATTTVGSGDGAVGLAGGPAGAGAVGALPGGGAETGRGTATELVPPTASTGPGDVTGGTAAIPAGPGERAGADATAAPVAATAATSGTHAAGGGQPPSADARRGNPVTDQVFGQVTRLVSRGDGTHRLTLRLHPADLGEVKVVMTVKDGVVDVTLSAGAAAREALRDGSPQLRSLLELAGATTGQLVVRELAATGSAATSAGAQAGNQPGSHGQAGPGGEQEGSSASGTAGDDGPADPGADHRADHHAGSHGAGRGQADSGRGTAHTVSDPAATRHHTVRPGGIDPLGRPRLDLDL